MTIGDHVKGLSADLLQALTTRIEIFGLELQQAKEDVPRALALWIVGLSSIMFALALFTLFVVVLAWDTAYRDLVVLLLSVVYAAFGVFLLWLARKRLLSGELNPFAVTLDELRRDAQSLVQAQQVDREANHAKVSDRDRVDPS